VVEITIKTKGMHCVSCERIIKNAVLNLNGVKNAKIDYTTEKAIIEFDPSQTDIKTIMKAIKKVGYEPEEINKESKGVFKKIFK
jgi:Cu+-exporting ATPase